MISVCAAKGLFAMFELNKHECKFLDLWTNDHSEPLLLNKLIGSSAACPLVVSAIMKDVSALSECLGLSDSASLIQYANKLQRDYELLPVKDFSSKSNDDVYREIQRRQHIISLTSVWIVNCLRIVEQKIRRKNLKQIYQNTQLCILFYFFGWYGGEPNLSLKQRTQIKELVNPYGNAWHLDYSFDFQNTKLKLLLQMIHILGMEYYPEKNQL